MNVALISCTKLKQNYKCRADEMYLPSTLFSKAKTYITKQDYDMWFILSAKYGLLLPSEIIDPYDLTLNNMKSKEINEWSNRVYNKLMEYKINQVDFYAGEKYRKYLIPLLEQNNVICNIPLKGLGIGQQLQFYTKQLEVI